MSVYIMVIAGLFFLRGRVDLGGLGRSLTGAAADVDSTLVLSGGDLAPTLTDFLVHRYEIDYPYVDVEVKGGGTRAALEDLINGRADVALLNRPPTPDEKALFERAVGDSVIWYPIALGTILVVGGTARDDSTVSLAELVDLASGKGSARAERLYVADPNSGLWEAFCTKLGLPVAEGGTPGVVFLKDDSTVVAAAAIDDASLGLVSSFAQAGEAALRGVRALGLRSEPEAPAVYPDLAATYAGEYPLWSYLYVGCLPHADNQGDMFVTSVTSPRGQRQIEQTEFLPAQQVPRVVYVNRNATGSGGQ